MDAGKVRRRVRGFCVFAEDGADGGRGGLSAGSAEGERERDLGHSNQRRHKNQVPVFWRATRRAPETCRTCREKENELTLL